MSAHDDRNQRARTRSEVLRAYPLLDGDADPSLDDLAWLATHICEAPIGGISVTDETRTWLKSAIGLDAAQPLRGASLFETTARSLEPLVIPDASSDPRFSGSPLVTSEPGARFFAGAPLITLHGRPIGSLFVMDRVPRSLTSDQVESLTAVARQVVAQIELRKSVEDLRRAGLARARAESQMEESEAILTTFYESAPVMMGVVELVDGEIVHVSANRAVTTYLECDPSARRTPGSGALPFSKEEASLWRARFIEANEQGSPLSFETQHESRGELRWLSAVVSPLPSAPQTPPRLSYLVEDVTSWRRILEALRMSEERLALALDSAQEGLWDWDVAADTFYVSKRWSEAQGYDPNERLPPGSSVYSHVHPDDLPYMESIVREHIDGRTPFFEIEARTRTKDGSWTWTLTVGKVVARDASGRPLRMTGTRRDISERKRLEAALAAARDKALEASLAKSAFLANMSHELRTPLNAILGYSEMLEEQPEALGSREAPEDLARLQRAARHLLGLINDILDLSKIESGNLVLRVESFVIADLVNEVVASVKPLVEKQGNRLETRLDASLGAMRSDPARIRQCLLNLLGNSAKFTQNGVISLEVKRLARRQEGLDEQDRGDADAEELCFVVSDTGVGIAPEQMSRLFQDFSQASTATTRRFGGTGLGLSITRRLCRLMGGDVEARSLLGQGSSFTMRLPSVMLAPTETGRTHL